MGRERRLPALAPGLIALALALAACGGEGAGKVAAPTPTTKPDACAARVPLLVELHGYSENAEGHESAVKWQPWADEHGFVLVTPQAGGDPPHWDLVADVDRIRQIIDDAVENRCVDADRVFLSGYSMGGMLISHAVCRLADRLAAVAPVAGMRAVAPCEQSRPVPALVMHGSADNTVLFEGGLNPVAADALEMPEEGPSITAITREWALRNGCGAEAVVEDGERIDVHRWPCPAGAEVELHVVEGGSHGWPTSANETIWDFFSRHRRRD